MQVENLALPVPCPSCEYKSRIRIAQLRHQATVTCAACSASFWFDSASLERGLARLERAATDFVSRLSVNLGTPPVLDPNSRR
jgi:hypothetical protein